MSESNENIINVPYQYSFDYGDFTFNMYHANKGEGLKKHEHTFSHLTVTTAGKAAIRKENIYLEMDKSVEPVVLKEKEWHEVEALEDNTVFINIFKKGNYA
jgi:hypothetical protein